MNMILEYISFPWHQKKSVRAAVIVTVGISSRFVARMASFTIHRAMQDVKIVYAVEG